MASRASTASLDASAIATEARRLGREHPTWYLSELIQALIDTGWITPGPRED